MESESDLANRENNEIANAKDVVVHGKTSGGAFVPILVESDGSLVLQI